MERGSNLINSDKGGLNLSYGVIRFLSDFIRSYPRETVLNFNRYDSFCSLAVKTEVAEDLINSFTRAGRAKRKPGAT
jgi:hypothetical protein